MWDSVELMKQIDSDWRPPTGQRLALAFHCGSAKGVDATHAAIVAGGFSAKTEPWDAFLGASAMLRCSTRTATRISLFAPLDS